METPCVNICVLDDAAGICIGCGRSGDEIARWVQMSPAERRTVMDTLPERLKRLERELTRIEASCTAEHVGECNLLHVLADHSLCASEH